ncbi:hypothetical protein U1Q18_048744, partial [Sarracenia purpurea var. burkii]
KESSQRDMKEKKMIMSPLRVTSPFTYTLVGSWAKGLPLDLGLLLDLCRVALLQ